MSQSPTPLSSARGDPVPASLPGRIGWTPEAWGCDAGWLDPALDCHGLVAAAHLAFVRRVPLELSPELVWLCVAQAAGQHVKRHGGTLRRLFVGPGAARSVTVYRPELRAGAPANDWRRVLPDLSEQLEQSHGPMHAQLVPDLSGGDALFRVAAASVLEPLSSPGVVTPAPCEGGIPELRLTGTTGDWDRLVVSARALKPLGLTWWIRGLVPILERLAAQAAGASDETLARTLYTWDSEFWGRWVSGWLQLLFPYLAGGGGEDRARVERRRAGMRYGSGDGPALGSIPGGMARCGFEWWLPEGDMKMDLHVGFIGAAWDEARGVVRPALGWAVSQAE